MAVARASGKQQWTKEEAAGLIHHLSAARGSGEHRIAAHEMLARLNVATGEFAKALEAYKAIASDLPQVRLLMAQLHFRLGDPESAKSELNMAKAFFEAKLEADSDDTNSRVALARTLFLIGELPEAERLLRDRFAEPDAETCRQEFATILVNQVDRLAATNPDTTLAQRLDLLQHAIACCPESPAVLSRLAVLAADNSEQSHVAQSALKDVLADGRAPASVHLILGTQAALKGDEETARMHLELARHLEPEMAVALNNLAWLLTNTDPPENERAFQLANSATKTWPDNAEFRATRGQILVKLDRYEEAVPDLELALQHLGSRENLHTALAQAYTHLGDSEQAGLHLKRAQRHENK